MTQTIITTGAGGVGKTTLSAAIAVSLARSGKRTIVLTIDPEDRPTPAHHPDTRTASPNLSTRT